MKSIDKITFNKALKWCRSIFKQIEVVSDHSKEHGGHKSSTCKLKTNKGYCYLKVHNSKLYWDNEVHAYEKWSYIFDNYAPELIAVHPNNPYAIIISELKGKILDKHKLSKLKEQSIWQAAGSALFKLHNLTAGKYFGPCLRNGTNSDNKYNNAMEYISNKFENQIEKATQSGLLSNDELSIIQAAMELIPFFEDEVPVPCHRDYCAANWLFNENGNWAGVIDFEFAHWDVRVSDFSRDPNWTWIHRPDLLQALFEGYGRNLNSKEDKQILVAHTDYALSAIIWGHNNSFFVFEKEGRYSLTQLAHLLK